MEEDNPVSPKKDELKVVELENIANIDRQFRLALSTLLL